MSFETPGMPSEEMAREQEAAERAAARRHMAKDAMNDDDPSDGVTPRSPGLMDRIKKLFGGS
jgi:hypothetical protein